MEMTMDIFELQMKINCFKSSQNCLSKWNIVLSQRGFVPILLFEMFISIYNLCVFSRLSVVHDQHRPYLQPLEELRDPMLRQRSAGLLWRHGLACQHE